MLSWGERGKRKWEGPGVNHAGWEAWLPPDGASQAWMQGPGLCLTLPCDGCWFLGTDVWPGPLACLCVQEMGSRREAQGLGPRLLERLLSAAAVENIGWVHSLGKGGWMRP